jgi:DNA-binding transcriptional ArsR family regulator
MPRVCTICAHPNRAEIDRALVAGEAFRNIAERFGTSATALTRHKKDHVPGHVAKAQAAAQVADADDLLVQLKALRNRAISILQKAEKSGDYRTALAGIREARGCIETLLEVEGELERRGVVNVIVAPEWVGIRTVMLTTLADHPEARLAVASALQSLEGGNGHAGG